VSGKFTANSMISEYQHRTACTLPIDKWVNIEILVVLPTRSVDEFYRTLGCFLLILGCVSILFYYE
jgi:hypothetical protein